MTAAPQSNAASLLPAKPLTTFFPLAFDPLPPFTNAYTYDLDHGSHIAQRIA
jgi:hypothetical protein